MNDDVPGLARYIDAVSAPVEIREAMDRHRGRRPRRAVAFGFVAAVTTILAVVAFVPRTRSDAPPGSTGTSMLVDTPLRLSSALDLVTGTAFGFIPGQFVNPDLVLMTLTPVLGAPTRDTGWYLTPSHAVPGNAEDCLGHNTQRILRWGSLSYAFWKYTGAGRPPYMLWSWTLGDTNASGKGDRREPHPIVELPAIAATTADGIGIGTRLTALQQRYGATRVTTSDDGQFGFLGSNDHGATVQVTLAHEEITGIGATLSFC